MMEPVPPISFDVTYNFDEYFSIVYEYVLLRRNNKTNKDSKRKGPKAFRLPWYTRVELAIMLPIVFRYKINKVGTCTFVIDHEEIRRTSKLGLLRFPWCSVRAVHRFSCAYLVETQKGMLPLPYRCLTVNQSTILDKLIRMNQK